jgi:hypothetical protein
MSSLCGRSCAKHCANPVMLKAKIFSSRFRSAEEELERLPRLAAEPFGLSQERANKLNLRASSRCSIAKKGCRRTISLTSLAADRPVVQATARSRPPVVSPWSPSGNDLSIGYQAIFSVFTPAFVSRSYNAAILLRAPRAAQYEKMTRFRARVNATKNPDVASCASFEKLHQASSSRPTKITELHVPTPAAQTRMVSVAAFRPKRLESWEISNS